MTYVVSPECMCACMYWTCVHLDGTTYTVPMCAWCPLRIHTSQWNQSSKFACIHVVVCMYMRTCVFITYLCCMETKVAVSYLHESVTWSCTYLHAYAQHPCILFSNSLKKPTACWYEANARSHRRVTHVDHTYIRRIHPFRYKKYTY